MPAFLLPSLLILTAGLNVVNLHVGAETQSRLAVAIFYLSWAVGLGVVIHLYASLMELFVAWYSAASIDGQQIKRSELYKLGAATLCSGAGILLFIPAVRSHGVMAVTVCVISLAGMWWQGRVFAPAAAMKK